MVSGRGFFGENGRNGKAGRFERAGRASRTGDYGTGGTSGTSETGKDKKKLPYQRQLNSLLYTNYLIIHHLHQSSLKTL